MKRSYIPPVTVLIILLGAAAGMLLCPPVSSWVKGIFMLFQQGSAHVLLGFISGSDHPALAAVFLSAWQSAFLPWQPCRTATAAAAVMGPAAASALCTAGKLLASCLWYSLARGLFYPLSGRVAGRRAMGPLMALGLLFPGWTAPLSAVSGVLAAPPAAALLLMALAAAPQVLLTSYLCSLMSTALSAPWSWVSPALGVVTALIAVRTLAGHRKGRS